MDWPFTEVEKHALEAQSLPSFPINLGEIRRTVEALLSQFGRNGIFEEYNHVSGASYSRNAREHHRPVSYQANEWRGEPST